MRLLLVILFSVFFLFSCSHHSNKNDGKIVKSSKNEREMFNKHCALSISEGILHVKGNDKHKLKRDGRVYYFSSEKKLKKFKANLESNIKKAHENWKVDGVNRL